MRAEELVNALADTLAVFQAKPLSNTLLEVKAKELVNTLAATPSGVRTRTLSDTHLSMLYLLVNRVEHETLCE